MPWFLLSFLRALKRPSRDDEFPVTVQYVGFFDIPANSSDGRKYSPAAASKMMYIANVLGRRGMNARIVSVAKTSRRLSLPRTTRVLEDGTEVLYLATRRSHSRILRIVEQMRWHARVLRHLLRSAKGTQPVIVYHSLAFQWQVAMAALIRRSNLVLEVEEVYQDVVETTWLTRVGERLLFKLADAFIVSNDGLRARLDPSGDRSIVIYGDYRVKRSGEVRRQGADGRIHAVYAGTLDPRKGSLRAAAAAVHLNDLYHIHILGFGTESQVAEVARFCADVSSRTDCRVTYDGLLRGSEYEAFLAGCQIGLVTQDSTAQFSDSSFPSKVLSYASEGLTVVAVGLSAIRASALGDVVHYYHGDDSREVASAIRRAADAPIDARARVAELDLRFSNDLARLLG